jgi:hypothetical protein
MAQQQASLLALMQQQADLSTQSQFAQSAATVSFREELSASQERFQAGVTAQIANITTKQERFQAGVTAQLADMTTKQESFFADMTFKQERFEAGVTAQLADMTTKQESLFEDMRTNQDNFFKQALDLRVGRRPLAAASLRSGPNQRSATERSTRRSASRCLRRSCPLARCAGASSSCSRARVTPRRHHARCHQPARPRPAHRSTRRCAASWGERPANH